MVTDQTKSDNRASEQRYRHIFENLPTCNFTINLSVTPRIQAILYALHLG